MDLTFDIRTRGRAAAPLMAEHARDLTLADLALLSTERGIKPPALAKIKARHHSLARALAAGCKPAEASLVTGFSLSRISILQNDPAFQELLSLYTDQVAENFEAGLEMMKVAHVAVVEEIVDRVESNPEGIDFADLVTAAKTFSDRVGYGPASKSTNVNVNVDLSARLDAARRRAGLTVVALPPPAVTTEEPGA